LLVEEQHGVTLVDDGESFVHLESLNVFHRR